MEIIYKGKNEGAHLIINKLADIALALTKASSEKEKAELEKQFQTLREFLSTLTN